MKTKISINSVTKAFKKHLKKHNMLIEFELETHRKWNASIRQIIAEDFEDCKYYGVNEPFRNIQHLAYDVKTRNCLRLWKKFYDDNYK